MSYEANITYYESKVDEAYQIIKNRGIDFPTLKVLTSEFQESQLDFYLNRGHSETLIEGWVENSLTETRYCFEDYVKEWVLEEEIEDFIKFIKGFDLNRKDLKTKIILGNLGK
jgi:hypothetical protein